MKYSVNEIIVVEGRNDESHLSSFIDAVVVVTNGYEIPRKEIEFLNNKRNKNSVIVLTDSDDAGKRIREKLNDIIFNKINIEVDIVKCNKHNKHGVAECDKDELINVLKRHFVDKPIKDQLYLKDIDALNIDKTKRVMLCDKMHLGICNSKTFLKRLNYLGITKEELVDEMKKIWK